LYHLGEVGYLIRFAVKLPGSSGNFQYETRRVAEKVGTVIGQLSKYEFLLTKYLGLVETKFVLPRVTVI
jgi:hypothetical protein